MSNLTHIDLFAGMGGFALAARNLGIGTIAYSEIDKQAMETYELNFPGHTVLGDITKLDTVPQADIVTGGNPCVAFSIAGKQKGFDDPRGRLWEDSIRVVKNSQPRAILFENVKGLLQKKFKPTFDFILESFEQAGYTVFHSLLNSRDFGVPQNRERVFIAGFRKDLGVHDFEFPTGSGKETKVKDILEPNVDKSYYLSEKAVLYMNRKFGEVTRWQKNYHSESDKVGMCVTATAAKGVPYNIIVDYKDPRIVQDRVKEVTLQDGKYFANGYEAVVRAFTPRESSRLQGYPDDFKLHPIKTAALKQIGNSITVPVVQAIMERIKDKLNGRK